VKMGMVVAASDSPTPLSESAANLVLYATTGEVIHASAGGALNTTNTGGSASYQFTYTMPSGATSGSSHTLYAVARLGLAGAWNYATNLTVTTAGQTGPNPFTFTNQSGVALSTTITSAAVTITGSGGPR